MFTTRLLNVQRDTQLLASVNSVVPKLKARSTPNAAHFLLRDPIMPDCREPISLTDFSCL